MSKLSARLKYRILRSPTAAGLVKSARSASMGAVLTRRAELAARLPRDAMVLDHAAKLDRDGFVSLDDLVDPNALHALAFAAEARRNGEAEVPLPEGTSHKAFWTRLLDAELVDGKMPSDSVFTRFALQPRILGMLAQSFGALPLLDYILLTLSRPSPGELSQSQLWHRDHDDVRTIKLFVYLTDVRSTEEGPFSFMPGPVSDRIGSAMRSHAPDDWLFARAERSEMEQIVAPRLSAFAVETSRCLHMGSRVADGHERLLFTATYTTAPRVFGAGHRFTPVDRSDELTHAVLGQDLA